MWERRALTVIGCGALIVTLAMGIRQSFGIFLQPVSLDLDLGRQVFAFAIAVQNLLFGVAQPFVGAVADRYGARRVVIGGAVLYGIGLALASVSREPTGLLLTFGGMIGVALSGTTYVVVLGSVARVVSVRHRSTAFGLTTAAGSFGMFAVVPGAQALIDGFGWQQTLLLFTAGTAVMLVLAFGLTGTAGANGGRTSGVDQQSLSAALGEAVRHPGYWLLMIGFFVCGFHVAFIATHLPAYLADQAISPMISALCLALIGFFNIIGSYLFGVFGDLWRKKYVLTALYLARAVVFAVFLAVPLGDASALAFSAAIGFLWLGTVPLVSGLVAQIFGTVYLSTLYGLVFFSHQVGAFFGAWLGGYAYDATGSYDQVWLISMLLGVVAGLAHLPIADRPLTRPRTAPASV